MIEQHITKNFHPWSCEKPGWETLEAEASSKQELIAFVTEMQQQFWVTWLPAGDEPVQELRVTMYRPIGATEAWRDQPGNARYASGAVIAEPVRQPPELDALVSRIKAEILRDARDGLIPSDVSSFSELHDYVDANEYGGLCDDGELNALIFHFGGRNWHSGAMPDKLMEQINEAQNEISTWIETGAMKRELGDAVKSPVVV